MRLFQPLWLLEMEVYHKPGRDIQRMKDVRLEVAYTSIPFDIVKQTIALFLAEFLYRSIRVEDYETQLFQFVHSSLSAFDAMHEGVSNFHLWFLLRFSKFVGIFPENNFDNFNCWFNIKTSRFDHTKPHFPERLTSDSSNIIAQLFTVSLDDLSNLKTMGSVRNETLHILMDYYHLHFDSMGNIRSLEILKEIFS